MYTPTLGVQTTFVILLAYDRARVPLPFPSRVYHLKRLSFRIMAKSVAGSTDTHPKYPHRWPQANTASDN